MTPFAQVETAATSAAPAIRYAWEGWEAASEQPLAAAALGIALVAAVVLTLARSHFEPAPLWVRLANVALRLVALTALVLTAAGLTRRTVETSVTPSRVLVLFDNSQSMALGAETGNGSLTRHGQATQWLLGANGLCQLLAQQHQVQAATLGAPSKAYAWETQAQRPELFAPAGETSPLGDALAEALRTQAGPTLAGVVLVSDGGANAGRDSVQAAAAAQASGAPTPVFTVGVGPLTVPPTLRIAGVEAPQTVYPNDPFELTVLLERSGAWQGAAAVEITESQLRDGQTPGPPTPVDRRVLPTDGDVLLPITFELSETEVGRRFYTARIVTEDKGSANDAERLSVSVEVEVIDRVVRTLLWAGGPGRDFQFLRNQLLRDRGFQTSVLLDTSTAAGSPPPTQTADAANENSSPRREETLASFPSTAEALDKFDVLALFDPDLGRLNGAQVELVRVWASELGGGVLYVPGAVHAAQSLDLPDVRGFGQMLPVNFPDGYLATTGLPSSEPLRVQVTRAGESEPMLRAAPTPQASADAWRRFTGFYAQYPGLTPKASATVYAELISAAGAKSPLICDHLVGVGRVACLATSECWRLRAPEPKRFETLFTNLLRKLAAGRSATGRRGVLAFDRRSYEVGETMVLSVRAPRGGPDPAQQDASDWPPVATVRAPGGEALTPVWTRSPAEPGSATARLVAQQIGRYEATAAGPAAGQLTAQAEVAAPERELRTTTQDVKLLKEIAAAAGGTYAGERQGALAIAGAIPPRSERVTHLGPADKEFGLRWSRALLLVMGVALVSEWALRRWGRLL